jgi:hypothetical protein
MSNTNPGPTNNQAQIRLTPLKSVGVRETMVHDVLLVVHFNYDASLQSWKSLLESVFKLAIGNLVT